MKAVIVDSIIISLVAVISVFAVLLLASPTTFGVERQYQKLIMQQPDGSKKVFVGQSVYRASDGKVYYHTRDYKSHVFTGPHWIEDITKKEYDEFKPQAEENNK